MQLNSGTSAAGNHSTPGGSNPAAPVSPPAQSSSLLPALHLQVTLQDYHLPDSDDEEEEETAIQRVLQQVGPA